MARTVQDTATIAWNNSTAGQSSGSVVDDSITNAKLANVATQTFKGRTSSGTGDPEDLTATQATALLNAVVGDSGSGGTKGLVPAPAAGDSTKFLRGDGTFAAGAPGDAQYVVLAVNSGLTVERVLTAGTGISLTDAGAGSTLTVAISDAELLALAGLTSAADKVGYFTGSGTAALADFGSYGRSIVAVADEAAFKALVNLEIGTDVQAFDAELAAIAGLTSAADKVPYFTGSGTAAVADLSSYARTLIDDANAAAALATLTARGQGKETIWIPASAMWSRTTNGPASLSRELTTGGDIMVKGLAFDTTTEEAAQFYIAFPKSWDKGTITFQAYWTNASGLTTETVSWGLSAGAYTNDDPIDTTDLGTEVRVSDTWLAQSDLHVTAESAAVTVGNTPINDDLVIGQIVRSVANDNMTGDAELLGVKIFFTTSAATDA